MDNMAQFTTLVMANIQYIILALTGLIFLALIIFININIKLSKLNRRYQKMMQGVEGANLENLLIKHIDDVKLAMAKVEAVSQDCQRLDAITKSCVQKVGIVRFNAFEDTGSDLSFAVALLDAANNGVVLSSIFSRNDSRTYAKPVINGQSSYFLTAEEKQALQRAQENITKA